MANILPVPGWTAKQYGLRRPSAQIARYLPRALSKNGLSVGIEPSGLILTILPWNVSSLWLGIPAVCSPKAA